MNNMYSYNYRNQDNLYGSNCKNNNNLYRSNIPNKNHTNAPKKLNFKTMKCNTLSSLNEVECFLNNMNNFLRYIKLYKLLR